MTPAPPATANVAAVLGRACLALLLAVPVAPAAGQTGATAGGAAAAPAAPQAGAVTGAPAQPDAPATLPPQAGGTSAAQPGAAGAAQPAAAGGTQPAAAGAAQPGAAGGTQPGAAGAAPQGAGGTPGGTPPEPGGAAGATPPAGGGIGATPQSGFGAGQPGLAGAPPGAVQATLPATPLTLREAEATALAHHPHLMAAQDASAEAHQQVVAARAAYFPWIEADVTGSVANQDARIGAGSIGASRIFNREGQGLSLSQLISDSGRTPNLVASSRYHAQAADQTYQATRADVLLAVDRAYFEALAAQALTVVARQTVAARQTVLDQVGQLARNNLRSQLDVSFAGINVSQARLLQVEADSQALGAYDELTREIGSAQAVRYALSEQPLPPALPPDPEPLVATALANRPDLLALRADRDAAARFERAERDLSRPTLSLVGVAGSVPTIGPDAATVPDHYQGAAINLAVPIFNGHLFSARRNAAHYRTLAADEHVRDLEIVVARDVRTAWASTATAFQRLAIAADYLRQANSAADLAQGRYDLGLASIVELTQAQLAVTQAQIESLRSRYSYQSEHAALEYTLGLLGSSTPPPAAGPAAAAHP